MGVKTGIGALLRLPIVLAACGPIQAQQPKWSISQLTVGLATHAGGRYVGRFVAEDHLADRSGSRPVPGPPPLHHPTFPDEFLAEARRLLLARTAASHLRQRAGLVWLLHETPTLSNGA